MIGIIPTDLKKACGILPLREFSLHPDGTRLAVVVCGVFPLLAFSLHLVGTQADATVCGVLPILVFGTHSMTTRADVCTFLLVPTKVGLGTVLQVQSEKFRVPTEFEMKDFVGIRNFSNRAYIRPLD